MRRVTVCSALLAALLLGGCGAGAGDADPSASPTVATPDDGQAGDGPAHDGQDWQAQLDAAVAGAVADPGVPGFAMAHVGADRALTVAVGGQRAHDDATALTRQAPFHLGSDTKAMTAVLLATYVEDGALDLDAPLGELFAEAGLTEPTASATLRDVLGHRAGLDDEAVLDDAGLMAMLQAADPADIRAEVVLAGLRAAGEPGEFAYSNVGYMLAGVVAERIGGAPWEELVAERVFEPLGMGCGFGAPTGPGDPLGHDAEGAAVAADDPFADNPAALGPAGTVHCPMADWAAFTTAVLDGLQGKDSPVLTAATVADLFDDDAAYVAGWVRVDEPGRTIWAHDGSNTLWYARALLDVDRDEVLLLAANTGEQAAIDVMDRLTEDAVAER